MNIHKMTSWWQSVIYGRRLSERNIEKLEQLENEIQQVDQQVKTVLEGLDLVSKTCTKGQVLLSCLAALALFLKFTYSSVILFRRALWLSLVLFGVVYIIRRVYVAWIWYNIRRSRLKLAKLKTRKTNLLEELKQKSDFYKVFDVLRRFDENYKSVQDSPNTQRNSRLEEESPGAFREYQVQQIESSENRIQARTPHSVSTEISRSSSSQDVTNNAVEDCLGYLPKNSAQKDSFKPQQRDKLSSTERKTNAYRAILQSWFGSILQWIVYGLSGEHNLQLEEQLEVLRETLELEKAKRKKLEAELKRILENRKLGETEEVVENKGKTKNAEISTS